MYAQINNMRQLFFNNKTRMYVHTCSLTQGCLTGVSTVTTGPVRGNRGGRVLSGQK